MKPILFNTEMVRALLAGTKTVTRRVIKDPYYIDNAEFCRASGYAVHKGTTYTDGMPWPDRPYEENDILWVREAWGDYREYYEDGEGPYVLYKADYPDGEKTVPFPENEKTDYADAWDLPKWHPSIHMPKKYARIFLRVTDVRIERLQEIDADGVLAEGMTTGAAFCGDMEIAAQEFARLWDSTIKPTERALYGWAANPWVWVIDFERCERPEEGDV